MNLAKIIGGRIVWTRGHFGVAVSKITQQELAELSGITAMHISHFECGRRTPHIANLIVLSEVLGVTTDWLLGLTKL